ncbi:MAG: sigma-54 interaction domain-containing protein [Phycisphaerales bacterium]
MLPLNLVRAAVLLLDRAGRVVSTNLAAIDLFRQEVPGWEFGDEVPAARAWLGELLDSGRGAVRAGSARGVALASGGAGESTVVDMVLEPVPPEVGAAEGVVACLTAIDMTGRAALEAEVARLRASMSQAERDKAKLQNLQMELGQEFQSATMVGGSSALARVRAQVARVGPTDTTVLIHGETGSGKELVARSIHAQSPRVGEAFVAVNCAALPESLIESELFGHERGAFTGADRRRLGKFELADAGTLFLDEVAELPLQAQAKLLRVIQESSFERVGGAETVRVNVRIVAATHRDLARQVERSRFREDLYYRLNVFRIEVPPLRERKEDLKELVEHLHDRSARRMARPVLPLSDLALRRIMAYPWPGNVRELANAVERATLLADGSMLEIELPESPVVEGRGGSRAGVGGPGWAETGTAAPRDILLDLSLEQLQRLQITHALESCGYQVFGETGAAARLDVHPSTLLSRMDKFGIPRPRLMKRARRRAE